MGKNQTETPQKPQSDRFKEAARELEADPDEKRWAERLRAIAKQNAKASPEEAGKR